MKQLWVHLAKDNKDLLGLNTSDLDFHNTQDNSACYKLFGFIEDKKTHTYLLNERYIARLQEHKTDGWGLYVYVLLAHKFMSIYLLKSLTIEEVL